MNTLPQATLDAVLDHLVVDPAGPETLEEASRLLAEAEDAGIGLTAVTDRLLVDGLASFEDSYKALMAKLDRRLATAPGRQPAASRALGDLAPPSRSDSRPSAATKSFAASGCATTPSGSPIPLRSATASASSPPRSRASKMLPG